MLRNSILITFLLIGALGGGWADVPARFHADRQVGFAGMIPERLGEWSLRTVRNPADMPEALDVNEIHQALYEHPLYGQLALTLEYTADSRRRYELHYPDVCHRIRGDRVVRYPARVVDLPGSGHTVPAALLDWAHPNERNKALAVYWYVTDQGITTNTTQLKVDQALAGLLRRPEAAVMVRLDAFYSLTLDAARRARLLQATDDMIAELHDALSPASRQILFHTL